MAFAEAYFDESGTHPDSKVVCVAGYIFKKENAIDIEYEWELMLNDYGIKVFHMVDCAHRQEEFANLSRPETIEIATRAINLIKRYAERGVAFSLDVDVFPDVPQFGRPHYPYSFLCMQVMHAVKRWANETSFADSVKYVFELGASGHGFADQAINEVAANSQLRQEFRINSVQFLAKEQAVLLQCADILAWHWNAFRNKKMDGKDPWRNDFRSLKEKLIDPHHYDMESIKRWRRKASRLNVPFA